MVKGVVDDTGRRFTMRLSDSRIRWVVESGFSIYPDGCKVEIEIYKGRLL